MGAMKSALKGRRGHSWALVQGAVRDLCYRCGEWGSTRVRPESGGWGGVGVSAHVAGTSCDPGHLGDHPILFCFFLFAVFTEIRWIASWVVSKQRNHFLPTQACEVTGMLTVYTGHTFHG